MLDARKPFEHNVGTFKGSTNPNVNNFREFPNYLKNLDKDKINNSIAEAENELLKDETDDQKKFLLNHKIEVLKSISIN